MCELNLYDIFREEHGEELFFTWKRKLKNETVQRGRLDFFLISESLANYTCECKINPGYRTDHSLVSISVEFDKTTKCKTFWKFNNSLLYNIEYAGEVKQVILDVKKQYATSPYDPNNINKIEYSLIQTTINPQLFYEILLVEIRAKTISFA